MEEFTDGVAAPLRAAGFDVKVDDWAIVVAGCRFRIWRNYRNNIITLDGVRRFRRYARTGYDLAEAVTYIIRQLPHRLEQAAKEQTAVMYMEQAKELTATVADPRIKCYGTEKGIRVEFTTKEYALAMMMLDFVREYGE